VPTGGGVDTAERAGEDARCDRDRYTIPEQAAATEPTSKTGPKMRAAREITLETT
jgi:hypothetical protein